MPPADGRKRRRAESDDRAGVAAAAAVAVEWQRAATAGAEFGRRGGSSDEASACEPRRVSTANR